MEKHFPVSRKGRRQRRRSRLHPDSEGDIVVVLEKSAASTEECMKGCRRKRMQKTIKEENRL
jgi:hypothetical protein